MSQLGLFDAVGRPDFAEERRLAPRLPEALKFGTSSWTFPGWSGLVYPAGTSEAELRQRGLSLYCENPLFGTVGIDRSYYRPLDAPALRAYRRQLPAGFRCVAKAPAAFTTRYEAQSIFPNQNFLDPKGFEEQVLRPIAAEFAEHQGPLVLEFPELPHAPPIEPHEFAEHLARFFTGVSRQFQYAVELRDRTLLGPEYLDVLERFGAAHVFNYWERMPALAEQQARVGSLSAPFAVLRLLIPPGKRYADRKRALAPFDRLVDVRQEMRVETLRLLEGLLSDRKAVFVIVNNKAEGCSPLTIRELARAWVEEHGASPG